jgi:hypothetical protein
MSDHQGRHPVPFLRSPPGIVLIAFLAIAGFFLWQEHRAHLLGVLPYALVLACPLLHFFMHGRHGHHGNHASKDDNK